METAIKAQQGARSTDRVLEALSTLAAFLDRTINEVKSLDSEFQTRLLQAVHDTEASLQAQAAQHLEIALTETKAKLEEQFKAKLADAEAVWETERQRLNKEVDRTTSAAAQWEAERQRLNAEVSKLTETLASTQAEAQKAIEAAKAAAAHAAETAAVAAASSSSKSSVANQAVLLKEIERAEAMIKEISALIEDPATDLSTVIRKNVERSELEAYLKGIRYAVKA
ncbi:MAG: hypothetical protein HY646_02580 [Acidobacteria bacterium]|nr:hypothetical protein [Acidobacteriota bacterium]